MDTKRTRRTFRSSKNIRNSSPLQLVPYQKNEEGKKVLSAVQQFLFPGGRFCGAPLQHYGSERKLAS